MQFEAALRYPPYLFYNLTLDKGRTFYFFPTHPVDPTHLLFSKDYDPAAPVATNFKIQAVGVGSEPDNAEDIVGFLFSSTLPVVNYRTSLLAFSKAWQQLTPDVAVSNNELMLAFKNDHFLLYHAAGKASLVTGLTLSDELHDYLTMV